MASTAIEPSTLDWAHKRLDELWARGRSFLGTRYAILGGAMSWVSERHLVSAISNAGGFGVIAWPITYGTTGNMTFIVSQDGEVFEKDLGANTAAAAGQIKTFNPDKTWKKSDTTP